MRSCLSGKRALPLGDAPLGLTRSTPSEFARQAVKVEAATDDRVVVTGGSGMRNQDEKRRMQIWQRCSGHGGTPPA